MTKQTLSLAALGLLVACGPPELEPQDAQAAWDATHRALNSSGVSEEGGGSASFNLGGGKYTHHCAEGGKAIFSFDLMDNIGDAFSGEAGMSWGVRFKGCQVDGIKVKGNMEFGMLVGAEQDSFSTKWWYIGDLTYRGAIEGSCLIDMNGLISADAEGALVEYEGTICGNDASLTLTADDEGVDVKSSGEVQD